MICSCERSHYLAALDDEGNLTPLGAIMGDFPLPPQVRTFELSSLELMASSISVGKDADC